MLSVMVPNNFLESLLHHLVLLLWRWKRNAYRYLCAGSLINFATKSTDTANTLRATLRATFNEQSLIATPQLLHDGMLLSFL